MKLENIVFDILEIKQAAHDDSKIDETWLIHKINNYRALFIQEYYYKRGEIDQSWIQRYPTFDFEKVNSGDDPSIGFGSITLGKFRLPKLVPLPMDQGLFQVFGSARAKPLSLTDFATMVYRANLNEEIPVGSAFVSKIFQDIYVYPYLMKGQAHIIAADPTEVPILESGVIRAFDPELDDYPIDGSIAQAIVLEILTKDLKILEETIPDIVNDAQSQLKVLKTDGRG